MTTTCDLNVDWNQCANCARLKRRVDDAHATLLAASHAAIDEWAKSIRLRHRFHMAYTRIAQSGHVDTGETTTLPETEEMSEVPEPDTTATPIRGRVYRITAYNADQGGCHDVDPATLPDDFLDYLADAAHAAHAAQHGMPVDASQYIPVDALVNIYGGHIDKWLEALRERTHAQTDADTGTPCAEATGETDTSADADEASCTCAMCQALDALDNLDRDNLTVKVTLMPVHECPSEYEEEGEQ